MNGQILRIFCLGLLLLLSHTSGLTAPIKSKPQIVNGYVETVHDGDTITVRVGRKKWRMRLAQIDAPERGQPYGKQSAAVLRSWIHQRQVTLAWHQYDRYNRPLVSIKFNGRNINAAMVQQGHAWAYQGYVKDTYLYQFQAEAQRLRRGLWAAHYPKPQAPWLWRRGQRLPNK